METFNCIQEDIKVKITKAKINFKKSPKDRLSSSYIESRLQNLDQQWQLFHETHIRILTEIKKSELNSHAYYKDCIYEEVEDIYLQFKSELKEALGKCKESNDSSKDDRNSSEILNFKLPEVKIPMFSGKYVEWQTFRDLFVGLIHNNKRLDEAQKLYYLKGYLTGDAEYLLRNISVTSSNYNASWAKLESMYNNKRFLSNGILKRLFSQRCLTVECGTEIKRLVSTTSDCLGSLKNLGIDISSWDILVIHIISAKLDKETRKAWELHVSSEQTDDLPTYEQFTNFLTGRFRGLENLETKANVSRNSQSFHSQVGKDKGEYSCNYCSAPHKITVCKKFATKNSDARRDFTRQKGLCYICLGNNHSAKTCRNTIKCQVCKRRHHTLLHPDGGSGSNGEIGREISSTADSRDNAVDEHYSVISKAATKADESTKTIVSCLSTGKRNDMVLIPTAVVKAECKDGTYHGIRVLVDQGSQGSFITESMTQFLGLKRISSKHTVYGVGGSNAAVSRSTVSVRLRSRVVPDFSIIVHAYVLKSITSLLPVTKITKVDWVDLKGDELADPEYHKPNKIDLLLGAEIFSQIIKKGLKRSASESLVAQNTTLGWIVSGVVSAENSKLNINHITVMHSSVEKEEDLLRKFWELEQEPSNTERMLSSEEMECEKLYTATTRRDETGRYIVKLPFRDGDRSCEDGNSRVIAERRFRNLESKLVKDIKLRINYTSVIHEYIKLKHMVPISQNTNKTGWYLPHHAVIREDKDTTKTRVVFDASCKGTNGVSLNDKLMVGPTIQAELRHTIMRWRKHQICISGDIIKMYRQILVDEKDTMFQRILWRDRPEMEIEEFELITVTFGTASAPYLAVRTLQQVAHDEEQISSVASKIICQDFYMDDLMTGAENVEDAYAIYRDVKAILAKAGFQMQKWISNSGELLEKIRKGKSEREENVMEIKADKITKILGLTWDPRADVFRYAVELPLPMEPVSKRKIISDISRLYDPLGWLAPSIILAKILIQKLWLTGIGWDEAVPNNLLKEWVSYRQDLPYLSKINIPRWININSKNLSVQLHGFSDASKQAYAAVVYIRVVDADDKVYVNLLTSKTKVAPIKQVSIPRLELCGAVLLAKLLTEVAKTIELGNVEIHAWTDSEVVLAWLNSHPSRWKTFVANRVSEILSTLDTKHWSYIQSKQNPADCASRGVSPRELAEHNLWFKGPEFLKQSHIQFIKPKHLITKLEEVKVHTSVLDISFWNRFSSLQRMVRVVSYCRRFLTVKDKVAYKRYLSKEELDGAMLVCIKRCQLEEWSEEIQELTTKGCIEKPKGLKSLNVFLDAQGVMRVGGRLEMSGLEYDRKHPILIPKRSFITNLLIDDTHQKTMHGGPQAMITYLRSKYWVMGVKSLVRACYRKCLTCIRYSHKIRAQLMGQLPVSRVTPSKVFSRSGVDYAGPINIRVSKGRGNKSYKGYIALFVCMATRAIHLEAVSDLTAKSFLSAFKRFVARRGHCTELHSDNGTNFVGAARELRELFNEEKSNFTPEIAETLANNGTQWSFIPPHAPNFGGLWEAGIKSTKYHLKRVIGETTLTYEELATVLAQIEGCLNSRPLSYTEDQNELTIITPGHFLVGEPIVLAPDINYENSNITTLKRWQLTQRMVQGFWRRWSQDYLHQFLQRHKWAHHRSEPSVGDVVVVEEDNLPPGRWLLGKIAQKHPGPDNVTRVVTILTKASLIKRPVSKICVLPVTN